MRKCTECGGRIIEDSRGTLVCENCGMVYGPKIQRTEIAKEKEWKSYSKHKEKDPKWRKLAKTERFETIRLNQNKLLKEEIAYFTFQDLIHQIIPFNHFNLMQDFKRAIAIVPYRSHLNDPELMAKAIYYLYLIRVNFQIPSPRFFINRGGDHALYDYFRFLIHVLKPPINQDDLLIEIYLQHLFLATNQDLKFYDIVLRKANKISSNQMPKARALLGFLSYFPNYFLKELASVIGLENPQTVFDYKYLHKLTRTTKPLTKPKQHVNVIIPQPNQDEIIAVYFPKGLKQK